MSTFGRGAVVLAAGACALLAVQGAYAATSTPNDPLFVNGDQWALSGAAVSIDAPAAWCLASGAGVTIADIDTGADFSHQDLQGKLIAGAAFLGGTGQPTGSGVAAVSDDFGHGTMTTGIMVASTNNGLGIASVAPDARALIVKVLDSHGGGYDNDIGAGINWAVANGATVINLSLGPDIPAPQSPADAIQQAIVSAYQHGVAVAIAAGNSGIAASPQTLAAINGYALVVGAKGPDGTIASYSNSTIGVNIYAPGGDAPSSSAETVQNSIVSTYNHDTRGNPSDGYAYGDGTSFATPQVAGVLAMLRQQNPSWSVTQLYRRITDTARGGQDLDAAAAVGAPESARCGSAASSAQSHPGGGGSATSTAGGSGGGAHTGAPTASAFPGTPTPGASPSGGTDIQGSTLTPVTGSTGTPAPPPASLPLVVGIPAALLIVGAPAAALLVRRRRLRL